jgi:hypothetical protein
MRLFVSMLLLLPLLAQEPPAGGKKGGPPRQPKNLKVLPAGTNLMSTMKGFTVALGVKCEHCHVEHDFPNDEKPTKNMARKMILMTRDLNANTFADAKIQVSCYTCHRGDITPKTSPAATAQ